MPIPRLAHVIAMSCVLGWLALTGCMEQSPYLRDIKASYECFETAGANGVMTLTCKPLPDYYTISAPYVRHMLADLEACYKEDR